MAPRKSGSSLSIASFPDDDSVMKDNCLWVPKKSTGSLSIASFPDDNESGKVQTKWSNGKKLRRRKKCAILIFR